MPPPVHMTATYLEAESSIFRSFREVVAGAAPSSHTAGMEKRKNAGALLVDCLHAQGATMLFGVPGESYLPVLDALHNSPLRFINSRNETGASFMAEAYGKLTGAPGLCLVTRGPGASYATAGVHTATHNSTPMLLLVGQAERGARERGAFQEIDYARFYGSEVKWQVEIQDPRRIPELISRAYACALAGRPGPVAVSLPEDMLFSEVDANIAPAQRGRFFSPAPDPEGLEETLDLLATAKRPLLFVGGGGWDEAARRNLRRVAEVNDLPVVVSFRRHDLMDNFSPCYGGDAGVGMTQSLRSLITEADVILAIGVRFGEISTAKYQLLNCPNPLQKLVHVHACGEELGKVYQPKLAFHAAPGCFLAALARESPGGNSPERQSWRRRVRAAFEARLAVPQQPEGMDMGVVMKTLRELLPDDVIVTNGAGNFAVWPNRFLLYGEKARLLASQNGTMGYGLPAAIAARLVHPERLVVCFAGDGDLQMTLPELGSAMQLGACPVILLCRNDMYGTIRTHQERHFPGRISGTVLENPDFVGMARAYGLYGERVEDAQAFGEAFERACAAGGLLELVLAGDGSVRGELIPDPDQRSD